MIPSPVRRGVLAGNSRVSLEPAGLVRVEAQVGAFRAGLRRARALAAEGFEVRLSVAMDHRGAFGGTFLEPGTGVRRRRSPRLSDLRAPIRLPFERVADEEGHRLDLVRVLAEGTARLRGGQLAADAPSDLHAFLYRPPEEDEEDGECELDGQGHRGSKLTCGAISLAYYERAARGCSTLDVYYEDAPWSRYGVVQRGAVLAERLGTACRITCHQVPGEDAGPPSAAR